MWSLLGHIPQIPKPNPLSPAHEARELPPRPKDLMRLDKDETWLLRFPSYVCRVLQLACNAIYESHSSIVFIQPYSTRAVRTSFVTLSMSEQLVLGRSKGLWSCGRCCKSWSWPSVSGFRLCIDALGRLAVRAAAAKCLVLETLELKRQSRHLPSFEDFRTRPFDSGGCL